MLYRAVFLCYTKRVMNSEPPQPPSPQPATPPQPVAYDSEGRPLYYHPPATAPVQTETPVPGTASHVTVHPDGYEGHNFDPRLRSQYANEPGVVHAARSYEPAVPEISESLRRKHEESQREYPFLNLTDGEFVIMSIRRHPIGLLIPVLITSLIVVLLGSLLFLYPDMYALAATALPSVAVVSGVLLMTMLIVIIGGSIAVWIYLQNRFYLTNESVIQEIQYGLFSRREQTVSLGSIEDASFRQSGIFAHIFNYGYMRLSTEGEETTYRFNYVEQPKEQVAIVNNAVEAFKNGRPVGLDRLTD